MKIFLTGASGYLGNRLAHLLADAGHEIHALVRDVTPKTLEHPNIKLYIGDIRNKESIDYAIRDCSQVYHVAAIVSLSEKNVSAIYEVNVAGTKNVLDASIMHKISKVVFTSSCGVIGPTLDIPKNETDKRIIDFKIHYDISKKLAEDLIFEYSNNGLNIVIVAPSKIFGPGNISHSLTANALIDKFLKKRIALVPLPGTYKVCFAYLDDIVYGHIRAMDIGKSGEKYILGGTNISYLDFFKRIRTLSGCGGKILEIPKIFIKVWAFLQIVNQKITGKPVYFPVNSVDHLFSNYMFSSDKSIREIGYRITPLDVALVNTIKFLNNKSE